MIKTKLLLFLIISFTALYGYGQAKLLDNPPRRYVCYRAPVPVTIDGRIDEAEWGGAPWTETFMDIEGPDAPKPEYQTKVRMMWDDDYFYVAAELEEPHVWATFTERDAIIFHENNFEVFIDPSGDTHHYYELEINALGTIWDLMLTKPYRNGGLPINAWDIRGLKKGVHVKGTINDPSDIDTLWTVEIAFPWRVLKEAAPYKRKPKAGEQWRVNFSRVQWSLDIVNGTYEKTINPKTGEPYNEDNWVWSPQWAIDMHRPEYWGYVQFSGIVAGEGTEEFVPCPQENIKYLLRELYYEQYRFFHLNGYFAEDFETLDPDKPELYDDLELLFEVTPTRFKLSAPGLSGDHHWHITEDSRIWKQ